jgi:hypothetical protein
MNIDDPKCPYGDETPEAALWQQAKAARMAGQSHFHQAEQHERWGRAKVLKAEQFEAALARLAGGADSDLAFAGISSGEVPPAGS